MPTYKLMHGGLKIDRTFHAAGSEVELSAEQAAEINERGPHLKLTAVIKAEEEAEKKKQAAIKKATDEALAAIESESKKAEKKDGGK